MAANLLAVALLCGAVEGARFRRHSQKNSTADLAALTADHVPRYMYKQDCFRKRPVFLQGNRTSTPGAGMTPSSIVPFETVLKDGYFSVDCVKDSMYYFGDKFGSNKLGYKHGEISNTSIVRYSDVVPKKDWVPMSPAACFSFCRTVPDMMFFGLLNGRHCYCTPFYKAMESDNSPCSSVCEGDTTRICGSKTKSAIFEMHLCQQTAQDVGDALAALEDAVGPLQALIASSNATATDVMQTQGKALRDMFGQVGDPAAADLCQGMMNVAGKVLQAVTSGAAIAEQAAAMEEEKGKLSLDGPISYEDTIKAEELAGSMKKLATQAKEAQGSFSTGDHISQAKFEELFGNSSFDAGAGFGGLANASKQYYSVMYFVDKEFLHVPTTCSGDPVGGPILATADGCATACDLSVHDCVGYQTMASSPGDSGFCFLFSKLKTAQYYTSCTNKTEDCTSGFKCMVKFSKFDGTTLKPDPSGKCKRCLRTASKADRCFDVPHGVSGCGPPPTTITETTTKMPIDPCSLPFTAC